MRMAALDGSGLNTGHKDAIQDLCYDFYGRRLATCSMDRSVKIWTSETDTGRWRCTAHWQAHNGSVMRVRWAHPEFSSSLLVTCGFDCKVIVWEETKEEGEFERRAELLESRRELMDVAFAPVFLGLQFASASKDGLVRVYSSIDPSDLTKWTLIEEFYGVGTAEGKVGLTALSWNPSPVDPPGLVVAAEDKTARIWLYDVDTRSWYMSLKLVGHEGDVHAVAWAPNPGRTYHLIATVSSDKNVHVYSIPLEQFSPVARQMPTLRPLSRLQGHKGAVWRAEWNVSGTALATSGEDETRIWQARSHDSSQWYCVGTLSSSER
mmetsp:Transcript_9785/g.29741  ORF Transcript_9785/g.29741 Transcript_9785/m.29741 type:complete len:321 (+) Transcript_9785:1509-2471(+)